MGDPHQRTSRDAGPRSIVRELRPDLVDIGRSVHATIGERRHLARDRTERARHAGHPLRLRVPRGRCRRVRYGRRRDLTRWDRVRHQLRGTAATDRAHRGRGPAEVAGPRRCSLSSGPVRRRIKGDRQPFAPGGRRGPGPRRAMGRGSRIRPVGGSGGAGGAGGAPHGGPAGGQRERTSPGATAARHARFRQSLPRGPAGRRRSSIQSARPPWASARIRSS